MAKGNVWEQEHKTNSTSEFLLVKMCHKVYESKTNYLPSNVIKLIKS